jgi:hypothetical protein
VLICFALLACQQAQSAAVAAAAAETIPYPASEREHHFRPEDCTRFLLLSDVQLVPCEATGWCGAISIINSAFGQTARTYSALETNLFVSQALNEWSSYVLGVQTTWQVVVDQSLGSGGNAPLSAAQLQRASPFDGLQLDEHVTEQDDCVRLCHLVKAAKSR